MAPTAVNTAEKRIDLDDEMRAYVRGISRHLAGGDRHLAEDIEQETFIVALQHRPRDPKATRAWLWSVARSCLSAVTGRASRRPRTVTFTDEAPAPMSRDSAGGDPADALARQELRATLDRALAKLPDDYANVISLRVLEGLPPRKIAEELGVPVNTVRTRTRRGFDRLRLDIDDSLGDDPYSDQRPLLGIGSFFARPWRAAAALFVAAPVLVLGYWAFENQNAELGGPTVSAGDAQAAAPPEVQLAAVPDTGRGLMAGPPQDPLVSLEPGATAEPVVVSAPIAVTVLGPDGAPAAGAELFEHGGFGGAVRRVGETNARGEAQVRLAGRNRYIAARGLPGQLSRAVLMDQPSVAAESTLVLRLSDYPLAWIDIDASALGLTSPDIRVEGIPVDRRIYCQEGLAGGISGTSCWVPSWDGPSGREGVVWGDAKKTLCVYVDGLAAAIAGPFGLFDPAPQSIAVERPWALRGKLVSAEGHAITNKLIRFRTRVPSGQNNRRIHTDEDGRFEIDGLTASTVQVESYALHSITFKRPDGPMLDAGTVVLDELVPRLTVRGSVRGVSAPFAIYTITRSGTGTPKAIVLTVSAARHITVIHDAEGHFTLSQSPDAILGIVVMGAPGGEPIPMTLVSRPEGGWPEDGIEVLVDRSASATLRAKIAKKHLPSRVHMRHVESGFCTTTNARGTEFRSPALFAGTWAITLQGRSGRLSPCATVTLSAEADLDLGELVAQTGDVQFSWPARALEGNPSDWLYVTLKSEGEVVLWRAVARRDVERVFAETTLPAGGYRLVVQTLGEAYQADFEVVAGELAACDLR